MARFRARARALDMLGRQQIAGVPTAVNELFKNAYDAYATKVEAHLVRPANLLIIRDNGFGMSLHDFESRWLVIGTESKYRAEIDPESVYVPPGVSRRPLAGEKGIGRLAIGILGTQTFVLSRAQRGNVLSPPILAFVNWGAFGIPNIDLADIEVPTYELKDNEGLTDDLMLRLVHEFRDGLVRACVGKSTHGEEEQVLAELDRAGRGTEEWLNALQSAEFAPRTAGTTFLIQPVGSSVLDSIDESSGRSSESRVVLELAGFSNTMAPAPLGVPIQTSFWDHRGAGDSVNLLEEAQFWTSEDFALADHEIRGRVDTFGTFRGSIRIFGNTASDHVVPFDGTLGRKTECGPFEVALSVVQGAQRESALDPDQFALMSRRLLRFAGVFVYRDGLRVLPYGRHDQDWLGIEERRTRQATYYFFSHRRMFGYVGVSRSNNAGLKEKAGREGFQDNRAYRQFRDILEKLLIQLAADFFRGKEDEATPFRLGLLANERLNRARERFGKSKQKRLKDFRRSMQQVESLLNDEVLEQAIADVVQTAQSKVRTLPTGLEHDDLVGRLASFETVANESLNELWRNLDFAKPRGVAIGKNLERAYEIVVDRRAQAESSLFAPARQRLHRTMEAVAKEAGASFDQRLRVTTLLKSETDSAIRRAKRSGASARAAVHDVATRVAVLTETIIADLDQRLRLITVRTSEFAFESRGDEDADRLLAECLHEIRLASEFLTGALESIADLFRATEIEWDSETGLVSSLDESQALDEQVEGLREQADNDLELAQLGLAVDIINHEFLGSVNAIRKGLRSLESWAAINPDMITLRDVLTNNFNHLENFLNLFTPLRKRFNAERTSISGQEIVDYLRSIFIERFRDAGVELRVSDDFRARKVLSFASVILPSFVNIVDNALFWLQAQPNPRIVDLAVDGRDWLVSDNGPGIPDRYRESVFSSGFTTKPGGRGLGLFIARQVLVRNGFTLSIDEIPRLGRGSTFRIALEKEDAVG